MSERNVREKLQGICADLDHQAERLGAPGLRAALLPIVLGAGLAVVACGDSVESGEGGGGEAGWTSSGTGAGAEGGAYGIPGGWGGAYGVPGGWGGTGAVGGAYGMPGGWGGWGGFGGSGGDGGADGDGGLGGVGGG